MANPIMTTTLPTIIAMGTVSRTAETMFGKPSRAGTRRRATKRVTKVIGVAPTKAKAQKLVESRKKLLRKHGLKTTGFSIKKVPGGYVIAYTG